jgi:hypothetical protein
VQKDRPAKAADSSREAFLSLGESQVGSSQYFFVAVPAIVTLEKIAGALEVPLYQLFYEGDEPPKLPNHGEAARARGICAFEESLYVEG